jgi:hypothetical protein
VKISVVPRSSPLLSTSPTRRGRNVPKSPRDPLTSLRERSVQNSRLVDITQSMLNICFEVIHEPQLYISEFSHDWHPSKVH